MHNATIKTRTVSLSRLLVLNNTPSKRKLHCGFLPSIVSTREQRPRDALRVCTKTSWDCVHCLFNCLHCWRGIFPLLLVPPTRFLFSHCSATWKESKWARFLFRKSCLWPTGIGYMAVAIKSSSALYFIGFTCWTPRCFKIFVHAMRELSEKREE